jgi:hypothetical protein
MSMGEIAMNVKTYCRISATIFTVVSIAHLSRVVSGWAVQIDGMVVPTAVSVIGLLVTGGLALWGFRESGNA